VQTTLINSYWVIYFNGILLAPIIFSLWFLKFDSNIKFWAIFLIGLIFASVLYDSDFGGRMRLLIALPAAMLFGILLNQWDTKKAKKMHLLITVLSIYMLGFLIFFGGYFLFSVVPTYSAKEVDILSKFDVKDNYLLLSSRLDYASRYYSDILPNHQLTTEWYNFTSNSSQTDPKIQLFYGIGNWKETAWRIADGKEIYIFWSNGDVVINQTIMNQRINDGEIKLLLPKDSQTYLGELIYR